MTLYVLIQIQSKFYTDINSSHKFWYHRLFLCFSWKCLCQDYQKLNYQRFTGCTGKSLSVYLIFPSTNPQHDDPLFIELWVQCTKIARSEQAQNRLRTCCVHKLFWVPKQKQKIICVRVHKHVLSLQFSCTEHVIQWTTFCKTNIVG